MDRPDPGERGTEAPRIRALPEETIRLIAAGEVVERPASVVKELVENALDAGATEIGIRIEKGGLDLVEVSDNGDGIVPEDLPLAVQRYATSKLSGPRGLDAISTLGFRGEALAAIAAVARLRITSRIRGRDSAARMEVGGGAASPLQSAARSPGTTVEVRDLFHSTPARKKFLRSPASETLRISHLAERFYLARPEVSFHLVVDGRESMHHDSVPSLREALARTFGPQIAHACFDLQGSGGPGIWVEGMASHPSVSRGSPDGIYLSVNGRIIQSRPLLQGIREAYQGLLPRGRFPIVVLHLEADRARVDVNVHPTKQEVRFERELELRENVRALLRARLQDQPRTLPEVSVPAPVAEPDPPHSFLAAEVEGSMGRLRPLEAFLPGFPEVSRPSPPEGANARPEGPGAWVPGSPVHPSISVLGQLGRLYIVAESLQPDGSLVLVDAHAASERIVFERLREKSVVPRQELLEAREVELTPRQAQAWELYGERLREMGFEVDPFGQRTYRVRAVPSILGHRLRPESVPALLDDLAADLPREAVERAPEEIWKTTACHMAIRAGDVLSSDETHRLLRELYRTPENFTCPHGRPIMVSIPRERLDRWFHRP